MAYKRCLITNNNPVQLLDKSKYPATQTVAGVTFTNNGDGSFAANGTSTGTAQIRLFLIDVIETHKYLLYSSSGGHTFAHSNGKYASGIFAGFSGILDIFIKAGNSGTIASNLTFKPQLFDLTEMFGAGNEPTTVAEFRALYPNELYPYNPTNYVSSYKKMMKVSDVCQLLDKSKYFETTTKNGITFTNNGDGTITVNGTATTTTYLFITGGINISLNTSHRYLTLGCPTGGSYSSFFLYLDNGGNIAPPDFGNGSIGRPTKDKASVTICIYSNIKFSNAVFKPQLFDLTEMYGAGNEPTTVAAFREKFPNEMYPYSPQCFVTAYKNNMVTKTKNLLNFPSLVRGYPSNNDGNTTALRTFTEGTYIVGMTRNNYYNPNVISKCRISENKISFTNYNSGYGVSIPLLLNIGTEYTVSCKADNDFYPGIGVSYYKEDGTWISQTANEIITNNPSHTFTVPENAYYTLITFFGRINNSYTFSDIQLELGSTATDYVPYGYL